MEFPVSETVIDQTYSIRNLTTGNFCFYLDSVMRYFHAELTELIINVTDYHKDNFSVQISYHVNFNFHF